LYRSVSPERAVPYVEQVVDDDGFDEVFDDLFRTAFSVTRRLLCNTAAAEDAAAESLARTLVAWRRIANLENKQGFVSRVATNVALDQLRKRPPPIETEVRVGDGSDETALRLALVAAMGTLSRRQRQVIAMRYLADLDESAVAHSLGISVNSVKKHTQRGLAALRGPMGPYGRGVNLVLE
jgi:RNA polymerase sigma factor (sigma-70 family)